MKTVILCGGKGTRLREETEFKPKPLVAVGPMPILWHIMKIYSFHNYRDFILCLGYKAEMIKDYFLNFEEWSNDFTLKLRSSRNGKIIHHQPYNLEDWNITFADTGLNSMTGARVARIKKYLDDDEDFFLTYGDGVADIDLKKLYDFHKTNGKIVTVTGLKPPTFYGTLETEGNNVKSFQEKRRLDTIVSGGFFVCNKKIFNYLSEDEGCILEEDPLRQVAKDGQMAVYHHPGFWYTVNTAKELEDLNRMWVENTTPWALWQGKNETK